MLKLGQQIMESMDVVPASLQTRVDRLETLLVCTPSPSVDEVLEQMLQKQLRDNCHIKSVEPESEMSPHKARVASLRTEVLERSATNLFDIFEDRHDAETQCG